LSNVEIALAPSRSASPSKILELSWGHARTAALVTALELDVFTHIASGRNSPDAIASAADAKRKRSPPCCWPWPGWDCWCRTMMVIDSLTTRRPTW
jgi:hypothetical protein